MERMSLNRPPIITTILAVSFLLACEGEKADRGDASATAGVALEDRIVEASCGQCQLELPGTGCDLAVAFDGQANYVDGSHIDDHGDAHGPEGLCNAILPARVTGRIVDGRFQAERLELVDREDGS